MLQWPHTIWGGDVESQYKDAVLIVVWQPSDLYRGNSYISLNKDDLYI